MADLSSLSLLRNDPVAAVKLLRDAERGDIDAQYAAGLIYAEGRGVEQNEALSFFWLTLACEQGDEDAEVLRTVVVATMGQKEYESAVELLKIYKSGGFLFEYTSNTQ
jgi:TPR repeat protein